MMDDFEMRAREVLGFMPDDVLGDSGKYYVSVVSTALRAVQAETAQRCSQIVQEQLDCYPADIFVEPPPDKHGVTRDACSASALRAILPKVKDDIRAAFALPALEAAA